jgi:hypothetical protein
MFNQLRDLGFPMRTARISALRQLVLQAPHPSWPDAPDLACDEDWYRILSVATT